MWGDGKDVFCMSIFFSSCKSLNDACRNFSITLRKDEDCEQRRSSIDCSSFRLDRAGGVTEKYDKQEGVGLLEWVERRIRTALAPA